MFCWSWPEGQDEHRLRTHFPTHTGSPLPFLILAGCSMGNREELPVSLAKLADWARGGTKPGGLSSGFLGQRGKAEPGVCV